MSNGGVSKKDLTPIFNFQFWHIFGEPLFCLDTQTPFLYVSPRALVAQTWLTERSERRKKPMLKPAKDSLDLGILVSDIQASLEFYQKLLGLEFVGKTPVWFGTMHRLRFGSSDFKLIEPNTIPPKGVVGLEGQLGFRYVTFVIKNLSEVCSKLLGQGIEFALPEKEIRPGVRIAMVKDPDGNIVEFVELS
jgi:catechol 2,3-dioxygenase-like lactoylglutathione lyase family enzyme